MTKTLEIGEYKTKIFDCINDEDVAYLQKDCFKHKFDVTRLRDKDQVKINNFSYSGIFQLNNARIHFSTKVKTNLFYMLSFLKDEEAFLCDPEVIIDIKEGGNFFDIIGKMFLNELQNIFKKGFYKNYVRKEENKTFIKGKLVISQQLRNNAYRNLKFYCSYEDLTYDNLENRIILRAITLLIPLIRFNQKTKRDLIRFSHLLREEVSFANILPEECNRIKYSRLNENYKKIIQFSKVILESCFVRSVQKGLSKGFNFIVDMNKVYENFISEIIEEVIEQDEEFQHLTIERQSKFDSLVREKSIITKPDVIIKQDTGEYPLIIDTKYKKQESNADYYQVIAYALAIPKSKVCCLIYPEDNENIETPPLTLDPKSFDSESKRGEIKLLVYTINLLWNENLSFNDYIEKIKGEVKIKLLKCMSYSQDDPRNLKISLKLAKGNTTKYKEINKG